MDPNNSSGLPTTIETPPRPHNNTITTNTTTTIEKTTATTTYITITTTKASRPARTNCLTKKQQHKHIFRGRRNTTTGHGQRRRSEVETQPKL
jgi:hypothetical protein